MNKNDLNLQLINLTNLSASGDTATKIKRGCQFERVLHHLLEIEGLSPRTSYRPDGEEIDGSFFMDSRVFLIEAKWHSDPLPASALYSFKGKVDGKLIGTIGIFISMSGYSKYAIDALTLGKDLNLILFDNNDINAAINNTLSFTDILLLKIRAAAEEGIIYYPIQSSEIRSESLSGRKISLNETIVQTDTPPEETFRNIIVICEGISDEIILSSLTSRILKLNAVTANVRFVVANGKIALSKVAGSLHSSFGEKAKFIIVADSDGDISGTENLLISKTPKPYFELIIPHPSIESAWLSTGGGKPNLSELHNFIQAVDIKELAARDNSFNRFLKAVLS